MGDHSYCFSYVTLFGIWLHLVKSHPIHVAFYLILFSILINWAQKTSIDNVFIEIIYKKYLCINFIEKVS
jgi:hypothetical protein